MLILGIDPGIATIGYGMISFDRQKYKYLKAGVIETSKDIPFSKRLDGAYRGMVSLIQEFDPDTIAIEELFFAKNTKTAMVVSQARGALILSCVHQDKPLFEYTPLQVKQGVTGYGRADKSQVTKMVTFLLDLQTPPKPDDAADALAIAICHANHIQQINGDSRFRPI
ncbi:MAG: crossover junction endodeoxyribonuclease RuvC [bacterium]|nr:MAG: crossover junction endodeoxyribonuclease RuvC [bacterium]